MSVQTQDRMPQGNFRLIIGLGNPGDRYSRTRHNIGFRVVDAIAEAFSIPLDKKKFDVVYGRGQIKEKEVFLAKPMAFMNQSGSPVAKLAAYYDIVCKEILVIHDDIDLAYERIKIKAKGGHAGHNGIRSLIDAFGSGGFARIRIGIGRPGIQRGVVGHVLGKFDPEETGMLDRIIERARDATVTVVCIGIQGGMNQIN